MKICFNIDRGGTFTDVHAYIPSTQQHMTLKLLSVSEEYDDAPREGIRRVMSMATGQAIDPHCIPTEHIEWIRMGTTVGTNALLEHKGERVAFVVTKGFSDLLQISNQARPHIFDLEIKRPSLLYETVIEVEERVVLARDGIKGERVKGLTSDEVIVEKTPDIDQLRPQLKDAFDSGIRSVAVCLIHSYIFPKHERIIRELASDIGFTHISLSSELLPMIRAVPRGHTTTVDCYLTPLIRQYIASFTKSFDKEPEPVLFMQSDGGLANVAEFTGFRSILSGPAGGVVALSQMMKSIGQPLIGFDMGGTSTDVSRYGGKLEHVMETQTAGVAIQAPQLDITTVAAGGGSRLFFQSGLFVVGPESAGAHPGPICYRKNGYLAVTDANLMLGRISIDAFPSIFGPNQDEPLDIEATRRAFHELTEHVNSFSSTSLSTEDVAQGFIDVANEAMARPIRAITQGRGYNTADHVLAVFGGAGPQHCCAVAKSLGMTRVVVHRYSSLLSAYGLSCADVVNDIQEPFHAQFNDDNLALAQDRLKALGIKAASVFDGEVVIEEYLNLRYHGTDTSMMTVQCEGQSFLDVFAAKYKKEFGFSLHDRAVLIDDVRVRAYTPSTIVQMPVLPMTSRQTVPVDHMTCMYVDGKWIDIAVYGMDSLLSGEVMLGPCHIASSLSTIVVDPGCTATVCADGSIDIVIGEDTPQKISTELNSIHLSVFANRFMSIAEQMGRSLQRTATSVNIKERLDFSCAIFDCEGGLVANAPHLPVHLGAISEAVKWQIGYLGNDWKEGQSLMTNHPAAGGSHLPDITVITPVYSTDRPIFYVASRGHHADIGGMTPGSMPPFSRTLDEEGIAIKSFVLVRDGVFQEEDCIKLFEGTRNLSDNLSDLKAQVAANHRGVLLLSSLVEEYSLDVVLAYMGHVQAQAEDAVRDMLQEIASKPEHRHVKAVDHLDDGTPICLDLKIDPDAGEATFDFTGTGPEVLGNLNAPRAVTYSAILYCLRAMVSSDIPLNSGCLKPITIHVPDHCVLNPSVNAAVVGGNVLTSQRVTDVVLSAFSVCANSQGCMNNLTFGNDCDSYYETIGGGSGAGKTWDGASAVQTHMTNCFPNDHQVLTRIGFMSLDQIQAHFTEDDTLDIACWVDGRLEYHAISIDNVITHEGEHELVEMEKLDLSLTPTTNHRMWGRLGSAPEFDIHTAQNILEFGGESAVFQFDAHFEQGVGSTGAGWETLPFVAPLNLQTEDQVNAFLELYGLWLGDGYLDASSVRFDRQNDLDDLIGRLALSSKSCAITSSVWVEYFAAEYGEKDVKWFWDWVWTADLGVDRLRLVLKGLKMADGPLGGLIDTSSISFRDEIVRVCIMAGYSTFFWRHNETDFRVAYTNSNRVCPALDVQDDCKKVQQHGMVWCVSVPTQQQLIFVRRVLDRDDDGKVLAASRPIVVGNTRITDVEVFERRYAAVIRRFAVRQGSGGHGAHRGGDGIIREIQFVKPHVVSILSERRAHAPNGIMGGDNGERGLNLWHRADGHVINIGGKATIHVNTGDCVVINTPGGGGYGKL